MSIETMFTIITVVSFLIVVLLSVSGDFYIKKNNPDNKLEDLFNEKEDEEI